MNEPIIELKELTKRFTRKLDLSEKIANLLGAKIREQVVRAVEDAKIRAQTGKRRGRVRRVPTGDVNKVPKPR